MAASFHEVSWMRTRSRLEPEHISPRTSRSVVAVCCGMRLRCCFPWISLWCVLISIQAFALDPSQPLVQLHHTTWVAKDGVNGSVAALAQTADGYLWVGTSDGLLRFDGISFEKYKPERNQLLATSISCLLAGTDG